MRTRCDDDASENRKKSNRYIVVYCTWYSTLHYFQLFVPSSFLLVPLNQEIVHCTTSVVLVARIRYSVSFTKNQKIKTIRMFAELKEKEIRDLIAFLHALTDPAALDMRKDVPLSVPSGLPVWE